MPPRPEGFSIEEVRALIHPDDIAAACSPRREQALASDQPTDIEARYRRTDGSWRYVMTRRVVERDDAGEPLAFVGVALDVTEQVEQRRQAEELARRLEAASRAAGIGLWTTAIDPPETDWNAQIFALFDRFDAAARADAVRVAARMRPSRRPRARRAARPAPTCATATGRQRDRVPHPCAATAACAGW